MLRTLLIEDEATARADLRAQLGEFPEVEVVGEAATVDSARALLLSADYQLVFLDVNLIGGEGFDLIGDVRPRARVIFATAYEQYAVRAFQVNALDYLLKPIDPELLKETVRRAAAAFERDPDEGPVESAEFAGPLRTSDTIYLRESGRGRFVALREISLINSADNYSEVTLAGGKQMLIRKSLAAWETALPPNYFFRIHRTAIVNLGRVSAYSRDPDKRTRLELEGLPTPVWATRRAWIELGVRLAALRKTV